MHARGCNKFVIGVAGPYEPQLRLYLGLLIEYHRVFRTMLTISSYAKKRVVSDMFLKIVNGVNIETALQQAIEDSTNSSKQLRHKSKFLWVLKRTRHSAAAAPTVLTGWQGGTHIQYKLGTVRHDVQISSVTVERLTARARGGRTTGRPCDVVGRLVLLYDMLGFDTGQFWGLVPDAYSLQPVTKVLECFASPFNHNLPQYCSALPEVDKEFGSIGSFFDLDNSTFDDFELYVANPPFVESLIIRMFERLARRLNSRARPCDVFIYLPDWRDLIMAQTDQLQKGYVKHVSCFKKQETRVYDYINALYMQAPFPVCMIYLSNRVETKAGMGAELFERFVDSMRR